MSDNTLNSRLKSAWNAFMNKDPTFRYDGDIMSSYNTGYFARPDRMHFNRGLERTIITSIYNRIAMDVASIDVRHVKLDEHDRFYEYIEDDLDNCLKLEANTDQTARAFIQDVVMSMLDEGCVAIVPVDTTTNPLKTGSYDIQTLRTGRITQWYPQHRDDIIDITDFNYVDYLYKIDQQMLKNEIATAILFGDGRSDESEDKIQEDKIRPIWTDDDLYTMKGVLDLAAANDKRLTNATATVSFSWDCEVIFAIPFILPSYCKWLPEWLQTAGGRTRKPTPFYIFVGYELSFEPPSVA